MGWPASLDTAVTTLYDGYDPRAPAGFELLERLVRAPRPNDLLAFGRPPKVASLPEVVLLRPPDDPHSRITTDSWTDVDPPYYYSPFAEKNTQPRETHSWQKLTVPGNSLGVSPSSTLRGNWQLGETGFGMEFRWSSVE